MKCLYHYPLFIGILLISNSLFAQNSYRTIANESCKCMSATKIDRDQIETAIAASNACIEKANAKNATLINTITKKIQAENPGISDSLIQREINSELHKELVSTCEYYRQLTVYREYQGIILDRVVYDNAANACDMIDFKIEEGGAATVNKMDIWVAEIVKQNSAKIKMKYNLDDQKIYDDFLSDMKTALLLNCSAYRNYSLIEKIKNSDQ